MNHTSHAGELQNRLQALDPQHVQRQVLLQRIVQPNQNCEYGRKHGFVGVRTVEDFQERVGLCRYEDIRPDIERMVHGEPSVLVSEPVRRFFLTSGSTTVPKYIPITSSLVRDKWRAFQTYWGMIRQDHPGTIRGCWITNFSDGSHEQTTPGGGLCSSESSFWNAFGGGNRKADYPLPHEVLNISGAEARYYTIARILLETDVSVLMALNPSTIVRLFEVLDCYGDLLMEDVRTGGLSTAMNVGSRVRQYVGARYPGNATRAEELRRILDNRQAGFPAARLWPNLQLAICWRSRMVRPYVDLLERFVAGLPQRDYITMASEGIIAIPFENGVSGGALAINIHFYEFIPEELAELDDPPTLLAHEVEIGGKYVVVLSTSAGLYRYNIGDVVQVRDFFGTTPVVEFLYRTGHTCSMTGEKLTEEQVAGAVSDAASRLGLHMRAFTMCPVATPFPHYALLAELEIDSERDLLNRFLVEVDVDLGRRNVEYQSKRTSRRLGAPELWVLQTGSYAALRQRRIEAGVSDVQVKVACLVRDPNWCRQFEIVEQISCESAA
jgi:GH3 auxin-responsive promoter